MVWAASRRSERVHSRSPDAPGECGWRLRALPLLADDSKVSRCSNELMHEAVMHSHFSVVIRIGDSYMSASSIRNLRTAATALAIAVAGVAMVGCTTTRPDDKASSMSSRQSIDAETTAALSKLYNSVPGSRQLVSRPRACSSSRRSSVQASESVQSTVAVHCAWAT